MVTKYIVHDELGKLRIFLDKEEAEKFLQPGWWIEVIEKEVVNPFDLVGECLF